MRSLTWEYLAGYFDGRGSLWDHQRGRGRGWTHRLRIPSYDFDMLVELQQLMGQGSIAGENKPSGQKYYRLDVDSEIGVRKILQSLLPYLHVKRGLVEEWLRVHGGLVK